MDDLEEVVQGNLQDVHQRILDRLGHLAEATLVVSTFQNMNFCEWHFEVSFLYQSTTTSMIRLSTLRLCHSPWRSTHVCKTGNATAPCPLLHSPPGNARRQDR